MRNSMIQRAALIGSTAFLALGLSACASGTAGSYGAAGQESTLHTPMGETGTPHGHAGSASQGSSRSSDRAMGAPGSRVAPSQGAGQESTQHAPMGETGTPHGHSK